VTNLATDFPSKVKHFNSPTLAPHILLDSKTVFFSIIRHQRHLRRLTSVGIPGSQIKISRCSKGTCSHVCPLLRGVGLQCGFSDLTYLVELFVESTFQMNTLGERIQCTSLSNGCKIPGSPRFQCLSNSVLDLAFHTSLPNCQGSKIKIHGTWYAYINGDSAVEL